MWAERSPNDREVWLLESAYDAFNAVGAWPQYANVEATLYNRHKVELDDLVIGVPLGLLWPDPASGQHLTDQQPLAVTLFGLIFLPAAAIDLRLFLEIFVWAVAQRMEFTPPAQGPTEQDVPVRALIEEFRRSRRQLDGQDIARALRLGQNEPTFPSLNATPAAPDEGTIRIPRDIRAYRSVTTFDDYFQVRRPPNPRPAPPPTHAPSPSDVESQGAQPLLERELRDATGAVLPVSDSDPQLADEPADLGLPARALSDIPAAVDATGVQPLVDGMADLVGTMLTELPLTIAITGAWGAGKSSVMRQLQARLLERPAFGHGAPQPSDIRRRWHVADFDAWKHERSERLWAALTKAIYDSALECRRRWWQRLAFRTQLEMERQGRTQWLAKLIAPFLPLVASAIGAALIGGSTARSATFGAGGILTFLLLVASIRARWSGVGALFTDPFKRAIDLYTFRTRFEGQLGYTSEAEQDVAALTRCVARESDIGVAIFVDDLDRCSPAHVVEIVEAVNQIFNASRQSQCLFVLGMDVDVIAASLAAAYPKTVAALPKKRRERFGHDYLRKIAQLFVTVPTPDETGLRRLLASLSGQGVSFVHASLDEAAVTGLETRIVDESPGSLESVAAVASELGGDSLVAREAARRSRAQLLGSNLEDVTAAQAEVLSFLEPNPRALKQFDSAYRLQLHVANDSPTSRLTFSYDQLVALAKWVVLRQRWPSVAHATLGRADRVRGLEERAREGRVSPESLELPELVADDDLKRLLGDGPEEQRISHLPLDSFLQIV